MFYILKDNSAISLLPEIETYSSGTSIQFKKGFYIFDSENPKYSYYENKDTNQIEMDGERLKIYEKSKNKEKINALYCRLKLQELEENGYNYYMPKSFGKLSTEFKAIIDKYPEYVI